MDNILFCSVGRRATLLKDFRLSMSGCGKIIAADLSPVAPALNFADETFWYHESQNQIILIQFFLFVNNVM